MVLEFPVLMKTIARRSLPDDEEVDLLEKQVDRGGTNVLIRL
jgi:hypothetical protein